MKKHYLLLPLLLLAFLVPITTKAAVSGDLFLATDKVKFSSESFLEGKIIRIYATADSKSPEDLRGTIRFYDDREQIQGDQPVSVLAGGDDAVFVDWKLVPGEHRLKITLVPFDSTGDNSSNNTYERNITVLADTDRDGIPNFSDPDDDNDGTPDDKDAFPLDRSEWLDSDGDGIGNNKDTDDDNDGVLDETDACPLDATESVDTDHDGICNNADTDDDNDGLTEAEEITKGTDPLKVDTDGDGVNDKEDAFPLDPSRSRDYDHDGIADNEDTDADNDGIPKTIDVNDTNLGPIVVITSSGVAAHRIAMPGEPIQFETTTSYDPDGKVVSTLWDVEGQKTSGDKLETSFDKLGSHKIIATLTDDKNEARQVNFSVLIVPPWLPWAIIIAILLIFILAIFVVFSYSKRRRSRFNRVMEYLETISKFIPTPKKK
jgi:hypothetical protein